MRLQGTQGIKSVHAVVQVRLRLASGGVERVFETHEMPIFIGRSSDSEWVILDRRVSRQHGRIDWRGGNLIFTDLSRYGTWLTFGSSPATVVRRETVQLHGAGVMYFGVSPEDPTAPSAAARKAIRNFMGDLRLAVIYGGI